MVSYIDMADAKLIIDRLSIRNGQDNISIINTGQLEMSLERPKTVFFNQEQHPHLYEKISILLETLIKAHCLSDGNKRFALFAASYMAERNNACLNISDDTVQLIRNIAMDSDDSMREQIHEWVKTNLTTD